MWPLRGILNNPREAAHRGDTPVSPMPLRFAVGLRSAKFWTSGGRNRRSGAKTAAFRA
jgi:hypothetical protein